MKIRSILILVLSVCILVLGALLPMLAGIRQDAANDNHVLFAPIKDVRLEFVQDAMTVSQTVALLGGSRQSVEIPQSLTSLGEAKAKAIAHSAVERYQQAGVFFQDAAQMDRCLSCHPLLIYGGGVSESAYGAAPDSGATQSNIYWAVTYGDAAGAFLFYLYIDDQTGTICSVDYADSRHKYRQEDMPSILSGFCSLYLSDLGEEFYGYDAADILSQTKSPPDGSYLAADLIRSDATGAAYKITFFVNESGFYTNIQLTDIK